MTTKKPGDETIRGAPNFEGGPEDSFIGRSKISTGELKKVDKEAAPEVSQGLWRERPYTARTIMTREEIKQGLQASLRVVLSTASHPRSAYDALRTGWMPVLRQAIEQAGGDGIDAWLNRLLTPAGAGAKQALYDALGAALLRLRLSKELAGFEEEALKIVATVDAAYQPFPVKLSFKQMERELEGKLEVDELLTIHSATPDELQSRLTEIGNTMAQLRDQLKKMPGRQPGGIYANFVRLKAELRVLDAELKDRTKPPTPNPGL